MKINIHPPRTYSSTGILNNVQCPHGSTQGACPICNGGGGGGVISSKKNNQYESTPETYGMWLTYLHNKAFRKMEKQMLLTNHLLKVLDMKLLDMKLAILISNKITFLNQSFQTLMSNVQVKLSAINNVLTKALNQLNKIAQNILLQVANNIKEFMNQISAKLINQLKNIVDFANKLSTLILQQFDKLKDNIQKGFKDIVRKIKELFGGKDKKQKDQKKKKKFKKQQNKEESDE